jgi:hypothetical protein
VYLAELQASGDVPPEYQPRLEDELSSVRAAQLRHRLTGSLYLAGRYETNANAGPDSSNIRTSGGDFRLDQDDESRSDFSALAALNLQHAYDYGARGGDELITDVRLYGNLYHEVGESDAGLIDLAIGPSLHTGDPQSSLSFRPFATGSLLWLGDAFYRSQAGAGISVEGDVSTNQTAEASITGVYQSYESSSDNEGASDQTGPLLSADATTSIEVRSGTVLSIGVGGAAKWAREQFDSYTQIGGEIGITQYFTGPVSLTERPWSAAASVGYRYYRYDEPDEQIDEDESQHDHRFDGEISLNVPLAERWDAVAEVAYTDQRSNYDTEEFDNLAVTFGVAYRFPLLP